jgi:hypothetical protein
LITLASAGTPNIRVLRLEVRLVGEPAAVLVVNHKGSISHASASLGALLGYSSKALAKMQLEDIIPVPYQQLHKGWIKVGVTAGSLLMLPCWLPVCLL